MNIEEVQRLQKQLKSAYEADQAAINRVMQLLSGRPASVVDASDPTTTKTVEQKVKAAIAALPAQFALADVMNKIGELFAGQEINRATVSTILYRLRKDNQIKEISKGIGRRAAVYGKP